MVETIEQKFYTVDDIQEIFKIGRNSAYQLVKSGEIPVVKIGKQYRVPVSAFERWMMGVQPSKYT